jgi:hypothetical protein
MATTSFQKPRSILGLTLTALAIAVSFFLQLGVNPASAQTIVDEWATVQAPSLRR